MAKEKTEVTIQDIVNLINGINRTCYTKASQATKLTVYSDYLGEMYISKTNMEKVPEEHLDKRVTKIEADKNNLIVWATFPEEKMPNFDDDDDDEYEEETSYGLGEGERFIALSDGTGMGGILYVFATDAPVEMLKTLEKESNQVYEDGRDGDEEPDWLEVLNKAGYSFEYVAEHRHVTPWGTSESWLEESFPQITEKYVIEP